MIFNSLFYVMRKVPAKLNFTEVDLCPKIMIGCRFLLDSDQRQFYWGCDISIFLWSVVSAIHLAYEVICASEVLNRIQINIYYEIWYTISELTVSNLSSQNLSKLVECWLTFSCITIYQLALLEASLPLTVFERYGVFSQLNILKHDLYSNSLSFLIIF